ncbi:MAG: undecaprenyl-diphosphate phosphatase [Kiritimatiellae bacterium]|nr:undecaprenyl-diphosphate phosphatase [Kiritimatiellia bacterium]
MLEVAILAVLQGVAEFLPISSSGHLVIGQHFLGIREPGLRLDICLHFGTLVSILVYYRRTIVNMLLGRDWKLLLKIVLSALPAVAVYVMFRKEITNLFDNAKMVGALLMFTGAVLIGTRYLPRGNGEVTFVRALIMGIGQAIALLPGVSRSGMTLASARAGRVGAEKSAEFSFLMSAPLIAGGVILEIIKGMNATMMDVGLAINDRFGWDMLAFGATVSAVVGYVSLFFLVKVLKGKNFWMFGPYCLCAGLLTLIMV